MKSPELDLHMWLVGIVESCKILSRVRIGATRVSFRETAAWSRWGASYNFGSDPFVVCRFVGKMLKNLPGILLAIVVKRYYRSGRVFSGSQKVTRGEVTLAE